MCKSVARLSEVNKRPNKRTAIGGEPRGPLELRNVIVRANSTVHFHLGKLSAEFYCSFVDAACTQRPGTYHNLASIIEHCGPVNVKVFFRLEITASQLQLPLEDIVMTASINFHI
jgi:hypothetical protein